MQAEANHVVVFHYRVSDITNGANEALDSSHERGRPLAVLVGAGNVVPGVDKALVGRAPGDVFELELEPEEAYGERREGWVQRVPKKYFHPQARLAPGVITTLSVRDGGQRQVTVIKVGSSVVDVDLNPPMAGRRLHFEIEIVDVREATREEIAHRHAHATDSPAHS